MALEFINIGPHSWTCIGAGDNILHSFGANQGFVTGGRTCPVVDSDFHHRTVNQVLKSGKFHLKHLLLLGTHYHSDHADFENIGVFVTR